jgi:hypothetical protein
MFDKRHKNLPFDKEIRGTVEAEVFSDITVSCMSVNPVSFSLQTGRALRHSWRTSSFDLAKINLFCVKTLVDSKTSTCPQRSKELS